jgi:hypothetical protein
VSGLRRCTPARRILELTRQLAEDYDCVPLPEVSRVVRQAAAAAAAPRDSGGSDLNSVAVVQLVEQNARGELDLIATRLGRPVVTPERAAATPVAGRWNARHQGVA